MLQKVESVLQFENKRNTKLITPCCQKDNSNGKFVTFIGYPEHYGYCHSCGVTTQPPTIYKDEKGEEFQWNTETDKFESAVLQMSHKSVTQSCHTSKVDSRIENKYIDIQIVKSFCSYPKENNLLQYLRNTYSSKEVDKVKNKYYIGTNKKLGTVFWNMNKGGQAQKAKVVFYTKNGKRTNYFQVPYKNEDGYYSCLFGEHLLKDNTKPIILVESEKTAIIASIEFPHYTWLAYGGINGLTESKMKVLSGETVVIIPDISSKAVKIIKDKESLFQRNNIDAKIFDMTCGLTDDQLKNEGWYNADIEDVFREVYNKRSAAF
jgi:hypothetical protein